MTSVPTWRGAGSVIPDIVSDFPPLSAYRDERLGLNMLTVVVSHRFPTRSLCAIELHRSKGKCRNENTATLAQVREGLDTAHSLHASEKTGHMTARSIQWNASTDEVHGFRRLTSGKQSYSSSSDPLHVDIREAHQRRPEQCH